MTFLWILIAALAVIALLAGWLVARGLKRRQLSAGASSRLRTQMAAGIAVHDPHRRVLEAENVLDAALSELGYRGTFGEKLRKAGPRFRDADAIWRAHKLRNRIAHEPGLNIADRQAEAAVETFRAALESLC